ncbi:MAG: hypothetical protein ACD_37C00108G0001, partial [uncultured bacterium]
KEITFYHEGKMPRKVQIEEGDLLGYGYHGMVLGAEITVGKHKINLAIKKFRDTENEGLVLSSQQNAQNAMENYRAAKTAGLKVLPTYRLSEDGTSILMTNGNLGSRRCYSYDDVLSVEARAVLGRSLLDYSELIDGMFSQATLASGSNIALLRDAFFFIVDEKSGDIDFVIGDLDRVATIGEGPNMKQIYESHNALTVKWALRNFLENNLPNPEIALEKIQCRYEDAFNAIDIPLTNGSSAVKLA